jgi:hypothetical protein
MGGGSGHIIDSAAHRALEELATEERRTRVLRRRLCQSALAFVQPQLVSPASLLLQTGARWVGILGGHRFILLVSHRGGHHIEAVGVYVGTRAVWMQGSVSEIGRDVATRSGAVRPKPGVMTVLLCEKETLFGDRRECLRLEMVLTEDHALQGVYGRPCQAPGLYDDSVC